MQLNRTTTRPDLPDARPPVILAHGLLGNARNLGVLARRLSERTVIQPDLRNHGDSAWDADHGYRALAADLAEVIEAEGGPADVVGHSMGGKAAMVLALTRPELVRRLVVLDIAPVAYSHSQTPLIESMEATNLTGVTRRSEADSRLAQRVEDASTRAFVLQSLDLTATPPRWKMNLSGLKAAMDDLVGWPDDLTPGAFTGPALLIWGATSDYVGAEGEAAMRRFFPQAETRRIDGAGHWLHAEAPGPVGDAVAGFLD